MFRRATFLHRVSAAFGIPTDLQDISRHLATVVC